MNSHWIYFLGDSVFDCGRYNPQKETPSSLLARNRDDLFPEFRGQDLRTRFPKYQVRDLSIEGARIEDLLHQYRGAYFAVTDIALISVGGNDFLQGLYRDREGEEIDGFLHQYGFILSQIPCRKVVASIYDPFFGSVGDNSLFPPSLDLAVVRRNYQKLNRGIESLAVRYGGLLDLRAHFLTGDPTWFAQTIEPSIQGASEVRRTIWAYLTQPDVLGAAQEPRRSVS